MNQPLQSEQVAKVVTALAKAQAKIHHAKLDSKNPAFKSLYASLESVIDATKMILLDEGIVVIQQPMTDEHGVLLATTLMHTSGEWIRSYLPVINEKNSCQSQGSGLTYSRRYALAAMTNIGQDDDDGQRASASHAPQVQTRTATPVEKMIFPSNYPENLKGRFIEDFATDELLDASKSLSNWKTGKSAASFSKRQEDALELILHLMSKDSPRYKNNELDAALARNS